MDGFLKWNCYDLAEQMEVFQRCKREVGDLHEDLIRQTRSFDFESVGKSDQVRKLSSDLAEITRRLNIEQIILEQAIDIYYAAEAQAKIQVETLPTTVANAVIISRTAAATGSAVMEDWLAALAFRQG